MESVPAELLECPWGLLVEFALNLAIQAGKTNMMAYCDTRGTALAESLQQHHNLGIQVKGGAGGEDFCTQADIDNERLIVDGILKEYPEHVIIGEESTGTGPIPALTNNPTWIIDPIDGTTNFASGNPFNCVSIGYCELGKPCVGVIYAPSTNEVYLGVSGYGSYRNGVKIVSKENNPHYQKSLRQAVICLEFGYARDAAQVKLMTEELRRILVHGVRATRQLGSGVLDMCYVATAKLDAVLASPATNGWKPWDYCAGLVIATEAGCVTEAVDQSSSSAAFDLYSKSIICATSRTLVEEIRQVLARDQNCSQD